MHSGQTSREKNVHPVITLIGRLLLLPLGIVVTLLLLEAGVRILRLAPPPISPGYFWTTDHPLGWALTPNAEGRWFNSWYEYDLEIRINSHGLRDDEHTYEKPPGTYRIVILGDSLVEAAQVPLEEAWHQILEQRLNEMAEMPIEVIAAGVGGWGTDQELLWFLSEGIKYEPDLVLLTFFPWNDFMNNSRPLEVRNQGSVLKPFFQWQDGRLEVDNFPFEPPPDPATDADQKATPIPPYPLAFAQPWLKAHSALYRYLDAALREVAPSFMVRLVRLGLYPPGRESKLHELGPDYIPVTYGACQTPPTAEWVEAFAITDAIVQQMRQEVEQRGIAFAVVLASAPGELEPAYWRQINRSYPAMQRLVWDPQQPHRIAEQMLTEAGIPYLDLHPICQEQQECTRTQLYFVHDGHWTSAGHRLVGEAATRFLQTEGLLPDR